MVICPNLFIIVSRITLPTYFRLGLVLLFFGLAAPVVPSLLGTVAAQFDGPPNTPEEYAEQYNWRIAQEYLNGIYIPATIPDAIEELNQLTEADSRRKFAALPEQQAYRRLFHSLRLWIINNWGFNGGSRFTLPFHDLGLKHPDDLAELVIISWHRSLNDRPLELKEQLERILENRRATWQSQRENGGG